MNLAKEYDQKAAALSIGQYTPPRCFELAGKRFEFVIDTAEETGDAVLNFVDETTVEWSIKGGTTLKAEKYECRKSDDWTYLVSYCISGKRRENHTWVIDKEQMLVTFLRCTMGENPYWEYLIDSHWGFGYIKEEGKPHVGLKRHGFSSDPVGTSVKWTYGHRLATVHVYYDAHWYRIGYPKDAAPKSPPPKDENKPEGEGSFNNTMAETMKKLPGSDEPCFYIKIKEGMYLESATEQNMEKILGDAMPFRSDTLCFLDNWNRMYSVGRGFGTSKMGDNESEIFVMIGKYASPEDVDDNFFTDPNPYRV
jgi:hypothetical protein